MISTALFSAAYLSIKTRLYNVGLYALGPAVEPTGDRGVLISCGTGGEAKSETKALLNQIAVGEPPEISTVWVEPDLYRSDMPAWIRPADFSPTMYARIAAAVIRPGVGTATDAIMAGARLFMFHEVGNNEMVYNAKRITDAGLGEAFSGAGPAWHAAKKFATVASACESRTAAASIVDRYGADQAAQLIISSMAQRNYSTSEVDRVVVNTSKVS
jgi:hypothetical protein